MSKLEEKNLLINGLNEQDHIDLKNDINTLFAKKQAVEQLTKEISVLEEKVANYGYKAIGIKDSNIRITITKSKPVKKVNYVKTIVENGADIEDYELEITKIVKDIDKEKVMIDFKDSLVEEISTKKTMVVFRELVKGEDYE